MTDEVEAFAVFGTFVFVYIIMAGMLTLKLGLIAGLLIGFACTVIIGVAGYFIWEEVM